MSKKQFLLLVLSIFLYGSLVSQKTEYNDGPYIDVIKDSIRIRWIEEGLPHDSAIHKSNTFIFDRPSLPKVDLSKINYYEESEYAFPNVEKYIVLGDPHGQYAKVFELLKVNKVIDSLNNWSFGDGHLVVMGDYFGRGDQVMEILWLFFNLEQQAALVNGHVHILIGNHDIMTMDKDLRYLNVKYLYTSGALRSNYSELFSNTSVLGNWLRSKNIAITVNDPRLV
ncbi:MAG TPA: metallophosphoesterase, partial [Saprospiraceae bacterium]|nr:metallophosphoesterase [Saprospiraceae bacterium]